MGNSERMTHWDKERAHARQEVAQAERERALDDVARQIRYHDIRLDELRKRGALIEPSGAKSARRFSYDPVFGWR